MLITGDGRVNRGVQEVLKYTNIKKITPEDFLDKKFDYPVFCNLDTKDYVMHKENKKFKLEHFINYPKEYQSKTFEYLKESDIYISAHYWDPSSPKYLQKIKLLILQNLR